MTIEDYYGKSGMWAMVFAAQLAGDEAAVEEGLHRLNLGELTRLAEAGDALSRRASAMVNQEEVP